MSDAIDKTSAARPRTGLGPAPCVAIAADGLRSWPWFETRTSPTCLRREAPLLWPEGLSTLTARLDRERGGFKSDV